MGIFFTFSTTKNGVLLELRGDFRNNFSGRFAVFGGRGGKNEKNQCSEDRVQESVERHYDVHYSFHLTGLVFRGGIDKLSRRRTHTLAI